MSQVIFALPRTNYTSYTDLYRLIELAGYPTCYLDEIDPTSDQCYIMTVSNGENAAGWQNPKARIILFDCEWRPDTYPRIPGCEYWHMDKATADRHGVRYVPIGGDARLKPDVLPGAQDDPFEVAYYGYIHGVPRRETILRELRAEGLTVTPAGLWDVSPETQKRTLERHFALDNSTLYLHVHQRADSPGVPGLRMVVAAAYELPFVSETIVDAGVFDGAFISAPYANLVEMVALWVAQPKNMSVVAGWLHNLLCNELTFRRVIEASV